MNKEALSSLLLDNLVEVGDMMGLDALAIKVNSVLLAWIRGEPEAII